jgi:thymidylate synthase
MNHLAQADEQLERSVFSLPKMNINPKVSTIDNFSFDDFELTDYQAHPHIKAQVAI